MSIGKKFRIMGVCTAVLIATLIAVILMAVWNQQSLNEAQNIRFQSHLLADELRQSSDSLTRLARTYVVTGDAKYEREYWDVLDIRNGKKARADGRSVSLIKLMEALGFTEHEFAKLKEAEKNSNSLVTTETIAMNAMKGQFDDGKGGYTLRGNPDPDMARRIMHDEKYHKDKDFIMKPIEEFDRLLDTRTRSTVHTYVKRGNFFLGAIALLVVITSVFTLLTVRSVQGVLGQIVGELKSSTGETESSTRQLIETSEKLSSVSTEQAAAIQETVSTLNEINATVDRSRTNARKSADVAHQSHESAIRGKDYVQKMKEAISDISTSTGEIFKQVEASNKQMSEIATIIAEIGDKTKVINDIVFQTKLLSFNASVEAARAGEQGKGFAVVAEEVGNLATMSGNAAKEISDMLAASIAKVQSIAKTTSESVNHLVRTSQEKISTGVAVAGHCDESLEEIVNVVGDVNRMMDEITRAAEEQAVGVGQITKAMNQLDTTIQETSEMASSTAHSATKLGDNTVHLQGVVSTIEREVLSKNQGRAAA